MASRRRWLESQGRNGARQENGQNEWRDLEYQGARAKAPPCPDSTLQTPLPQQSSSSAGEEEDHWVFVLTSLTECGHPGNFTCTISHVMRQKKDHWVLMEDRRKQDCFRDFAKEILRYFDNSDGVKVGITELQERLEVPVQICISIQQVAPLASSENDQKMFEVFCQEEEELCVASWARWEAQRKGLVDLERRCQDISRKIQMLNKRQDIFQSAIDGRLRVQDRAM